jgi:hypothetical protein
MTKIQNLLQSQLAVQLASPPPGQPCSLLDDNGSTCHGYDQGGGKFAVVAVVQRAAAVQSAEDALAAPTNTVATKEQTALTVVTNQVARVQAIPPASRTDDDKWLLAISYLVFKQE